MQAISGICFAMAMALAVILGGQTLDYTWGPALLALAGALLALLPQGWRMERRGALAWIPAVFLALAAAWIFWRCSGSPVREYARSDALLLAGLLSAFLWGFVAPAERSAVRIGIGSLALVGAVNLAIGLIQMRQPDFAWPFAGRPSLFPSGLFGHYNHLADFSLVSAALLSARFFFARDSVVERVVQLGGALANVACVLISQSRGGMISLCVAAVTLIALVALVAWRDKAKHRGILAIAAVAMPLIAAAVAVPVLSGFQESRGIENRTIETFADNKSRLQFIGLAIDATGNHPLEGGGSRSFGWQKYAAWKPSEAGMIAANDDFVHNELLQVATDYGWVGAGLVGLAVIATVLCGITGILGAESGPSRRAKDAWACGGLAAMAGTLVHSNFSFVTHTLPGALYLGLAIGCALPRKGGEVDFRLGPSFMGIAATVTSLVLAVGLVFVGAKGSMAYRELWPVFFNKERLGAVAPGLALDHIRKAQQIWPGADLAGSAAHLARDVSQRRNTLDTERHGWLTEAEGLYAEAVGLNPLDPEWAVNRANILSQLGKNDEAEAEFERAVRLEGGMEGNFRARYYYARHLYSRWYQAWTKPGEADAEDRERRASQALAGFLHARELLQEAATMTELWVRGKEESELIKGLEETISFLEGGQVVPASR